MKQPELGKKILELRLRKGYTQVELAEICNLSLRTVQRIESAEVSPRSYTIKTVFSCLDSEFSDSLNSLYEENYGKKFPLTNWFNHVKTLVFDLFNLKRNPVKKLSILSLIALLVIGGLFLVNIDLNAQKIEGWFKVGSKAKSYEIRLDESVFLTGGSSAVLESTDKHIDGFGTLMQTCKADDYLGKRIKMTGYIKSKNVTNWAGMWLRVDSRNNNKALSFDNMQDRPIKGDRDWTKCEIILDVPEESGTLNFGVLLDGTGTVWFDNISFGIVEAQKSNPTNINGTNEKPKNLDFGGGE